MSGMTGPIIREIVGPTTSGATGTGVLGFLFTVLNSTGAAFKRWLSVLNSSGSNYTVSETVLDSDGNPFDPI